ncbi:hypothetical protein LVJ85_02280 [Neisseria sp. Dent CA1/247]|uniref:hypothetical protein n=1 Tax=Neisseria sp. Dent CA1/247 TaxID=2912675 RepID=UPI001FD1A251|nr:hypothetical protein [Neisseria sp. Dent CA1/247]UOO77349.1 hypothetical protein LVJ85_02280 [Neisseria sp. Dent CA1/247]
MNIAKPEKEDFEAVWEFIRMLNTVSYGLDPLKPLNDDGDYQELEDGDKGKVLDAIVEAYDDSGVEWMMTALETLMSPENRIINQESDILEWSDDLKALMARNESK